jgi:hypothetical protein
MEMKKGRTKLVFVLCLGVMPIALTLGPSCATTPTLDAEWDTSPRTLEYSVVERLTDVDGKEQVIERIITLEFAAGDTVHFSTSGGLFGEYLMTQSGMLRPASDDITTPLEGLYCFAILPDEPGKLKPGDTWTRLDPTEEQIDDMGEVIIIQQRVEYVCQGEEVYSGEKCLKVTWESYVRTVENPASKDLKQSLFDFTEDEIFFAWYSNGAAVAYFNLDEGCTEGASYTYRADLMFGTAIEQASLVRAELSRLK